MSPKFKNECFRCASRMCYTRIHTPDFSFDEVACREHQEELAKHADDVLKGAIRTNASSTGAMARHSGKSDEAECSITVRIEAITQCPVCSHDFDALDHDDDNDLVASLFSGHGFDGASVETITCTSCDAELTIGEVERI